jgi:hypothetical protein
MGIVALRPDVSLSVSADVVTLLHSESGRVLQLNPAGSQTLVALLDGSSRSTIVERVASELERSAVEVEAAMTQMLEELRHDAWIDVTDQ